MKLSWVGVLAAAGLALAAPTTITIYYDDSACAGTAISATLSSELTCTPQVDHYNPICLQDGGAYSVSDCVTYHWAADGDDLGIIRREFGSQFYVIVEKFMESEPGQCGNEYFMTDAALYRLDENCYTSADGKTSHKFTLGHSAVLQKYNDVACTTVATTTTIPQAAMFYGRLSTCLNGAKFFVGGPRPAVTTTAIYDDSTCSGAPSKVVFSQDYICRLPTNVADVVCQKNGNAHFSVSVCATDYSVVAAQAFGANSPYLMVEEFNNHWCYSEAEYVTVYAADGSCHTNADDLTSFRATIRTDGSARFEAFSDAACSVRATSTGVDRDKLAQSFCFSEDCSYEYGCAKRYTVGGLVGGLDGLRTRETDAVKISYLDSSCSGSAVAAIISASGPCVPQLNHYDPICKQNGAVYSVTDCTDYYSKGQDDLGVVHDAFETQYHLLVENFEENHCGNQNFFTDASVYRLDENCYVDGDGTTSHKFALGHSAILTTYSDADCSAVATISTIPQAAMGLGRSGNCLNESFVYIDGPRPDINAIAVYTDSTCSGTPSKIMFTQDFVCNLPASVVEAPCEVQGSSHSSISGCAKDYLDFTTEKFGTSTPFILVEEFGNPYCYDAEDVTVYSADGACHSDIAANTSFRATISADRSAIVRTYLDGACTTEDSIASIDSSTLLFSSYVIET